MPVLPAQGRRRARGHDRVPPRRERVRQLATTSDPGLEVDRRGLRAEGSRVPLDRRGRPPRRPSRRARRVAAVVATRLVSSPGSLPAQRDGRRGHGQGGDHLRQRARGRGDRDLAPWDVRRQGPGGHRRAESTEGPEEWGATGDWVDEWRYPKRGLELSMGGATRAGPRSILQMTASAPSSSRPCAGSASAIRSSASPSSTRA